MSKKKQDSREPWSKTAPSQNGMAHRDQLISSSTAPPNCYTSQYHDSVQLSKPLISSISPNNGQHQSWNNNLLAQSQQADVHHYPAAVLMNNQQYQWGPYNNNDQNQMLTGYYQYFLSNTLNQQANLYAQQSQQSTTFYTTTADTIANSPLWEQLRLPTIWMSDTVFENHIKGLQSIFLFLMESNKAHLPVETLAYYATQFGAWIQYIFLNRQEISSGQQCDLQNIDHSAQSQDQLQQQLPVADSSVAQTGDSYTGSKETLGGDVESTDNQPVTSSGDGVTTSKESDSTAAVPHHSRLGNFKPWVTGTALRSNQGNGTNMRPLQSVSTGPLPHRWTPPPGTGLLGSAPGFTQSGQVAGRPPYFSEYRQQGLPPGPVSFPNFPRGGQPIRLLGPGPMASEAPPVYVDAFNPYFMAQPPPQFQGDHPSVGSNLIGQSILPYMSHQKPSAYYGGSPMYSMAHPPPQPPQSSSPFPQPPPTGDGSAITHQYILEKLRCTCKD